MYELKVVGIARFVARKNAAPKIIALVPKIPNEKHENFYCFYGLQIPFEEDLRFYEFEPLLTKNKNLPSDGMVKKKKKFNNNLFVFVYLYVCLF
jgi:ATP-dependent DNA helicase 2 subunit 2